jgi:hypothetical protein
MRQEAREMPNYAIYAQTKRVRPQGKVLVEWHLVDLELGVTDPFLLAAVCGESVDGEFTAEHPQSLGRWDALQDQRHQRCEELAGDGSRTQAERENSERIPWDFYPQNP